MHILLPGQYPRHEKLISATRDYDRQRISLEELDLSLKENLSGFLALQKDFPYVSPGLFNWQDLLRPFADIVTNTHPGTLTRFYETNIFWRILDFGLNAEIDEERMERWLENYFFGRGVLSKEAPLVFTLPFLYLFKDFSHGISLEKIALLLESLSRKLSSFPNKLLCFFEPTIGWRTISKEEKAIGKSLLEKIKGSCAAPVYIYSSFFSIEQELDFLFSLPVDGIGVDFYANSISGIMKNFPRGKALLAGIINTETTLIESQGLIEEFLKMIHPYISEEKVILTSNSPAELLPRVVMDIKVKNLQEIVFD